MVGDTKLSSLRTAQAYAEVMTTEQHKRMPLDLGRHVAVRLVDLDYTRGLGQCGQGGHHVVNRIIDIDVPVPTSVFKELHRATGSAVETDQEYV